MSDLLKTPKDKLILLWKQCCENTASKSFVLNMSNKKFSKLDNSIILKRYPFYTSNFLKMDEVLNINSDYRVLCENGVGFKVNKTKDNIELSKWLVPLIAERKLVEKKYKFFGILPATDTVFNIDDVRNSLKSLSFSNISIDKNKYNNNYDIVCNIHLLRYKNLCVILNPNEYQTLLDYEKECYINEDLVDVDRHLTLLSPDEYKDFLEYKKRNI